MIDRVTVAVMMVLLRAALTTAEALNHPIQKLKILAAKTILVRDGQPQASIVMPTDPAGQAAARILQQLIGAKTDSDFNRHHPLDLANSPPFSRACRPT